ncbi:hypothetical protein AYL99_11199 [Fonsecaea erecta]|uniref:SP-RING-type domain-containing protein n=1 Tax=Fonsecaea erecta TaxID=1367422 RepID=A0A178Z5F3_9EURO|nr:hypothetical protein AYL99_11199 [Fonsecaea erecta]OAP54751.1 hypothetical protein AYL99_11199 [Fonsecaea erecta]
MAPQQFEPRIIRFPLNDEALGSLDDLVRQQPDVQRSAREMLKKAAEYLTDMTGELNDQAHDRSVRHSKDKARRRTPHATDDGADENAEEDAAAAEADMRYEEFQKDVETLTKKMDLSIRGVIDDLTYLDEYSPTLQTVVEKVHDTTEDGRRHFQERAAATARRRERATQQRADAGDSDDDQAQNEAEEEANWGQQEEGDESRNGILEMFPAIDAADVPHVQLATALAKQERAWASKTLTEKYARNNVYRAWYRVLYDAKNPGEAAPPMPDESLWFAGEEGRTFLSSASQRRGHRSQRDRSATEGADVDADADVEAETDPDSAPAAWAASEHGSSDNELQIAAESTRLTCPLTLRLYVDPVTSKNCNHSYERSAILEMLLMSTRYAPFTPEQEAELARLGDRLRRRREREIRINQVTCPECSEPLVATDLLENPALKRRVARRIAQERQNNFATSDIEIDSDDDDDESSHRHNAAARGTQRAPVGLGSSSPQSMPRSVRKLSRPIKVEPARTPVPSEPAGGIDEDVDMIPQTPQTPQTSQQQQQQQHPAAHHGGTPSGRGGRGGRAGRGFHAGLSRRSRAGRPSHLIGTV